MAVIPYVPPVQQKSEMPSSPLIHLEQGAKEKDQLTEVMLDQQKKGFDDTNRVLDSLRRTRSSRGLGAPLSVPGHLNNPILITDADLNAINRSNK